MQSDGYSCWEIAPQPFILVSLTSLHRSLTIAQSHFAQEPRLSLNAKEETRRRLAPNSLRSMFLCETTRSDSG